MKSISNWLKTALVIGLIVFAAIFFSLMSSQIEPFRHLNYTILAFVIHPMLSFLIGLSCGWVIKIKAENAAHYFCLTGIMFLTLVIPVLYYTIPMPWMPSVFDSFFGAYEIKSLVFGLFLMLGIKSHLASRKAKRKSVGSVSASETDQ